MKKFILFARVYTWVLVILPVIGAAQNLDVYPNYVVIGAFEHKKNAVFFTDDANQHNYTARFEMNPNRNLYYVYVLTTDDREYAFAEALKLRTDTKYFDTWVFSGLLGEAALANASTPDRDFNPVTGEQILSIGKATDGSDRSVTSANPQNEDPSVNNDDTNAQIRSRGTDNQNGLANPSENVNNRRGRTNRKAKEDQISDNNGLQQERPEESQVDKINRAQDPLGPSGNRVNEQAKQVTITRADGTTVIAGTENGSTVTNDPARLSANSPDPSKNESTTATDGTTRGTSNDRLTTTNDNTEGVANRSMGATDNVANKDQSGANDLEGSDDKNASSIVMGPPPKKVSTEPLSKEEVAGKNFYFYVFRADNNDMVAGEVDAIDFEKARRMATYPANEQVKIIMPSGKSKQISFLCQVFGYRKLQKEFDPANPAEDMYLDDKGNVVVPFDLMRLQKGDIAIMYNVFFFKDAAVMRPESRYEVNNLLELLQENPTYKIKIHGHTNGNAAGKIIYMDKPGNFYSLSNTRQGGGSAKKLSEERAALIREYLISSGIAAERMQVEAWGGKKPIHDKHSARAHENVRVEIEILSD